MNGTLSFTLFQIRQVPRYKGYLCFSVLLCGLLSLAGSAFFGLMECAAVYFLTYGLLAWEGSSKSEYLLFTLPVSRRQIVLGRYLFGLLVVAFVNLVGLLCGWLGGIIGLSDTLAPSVYWTSAAGSLLFLALIYPMILYLGVQKARWLAIILYCLLISFYSLIGSWDAAPAAPPLLPDSGLSSALFAAGAAVYLASLAVAMGLYSKKQLKE